MGLNCMLVSVQFETTVAEAGHFGDVITDFVFIFHAFRDFDFVWQTAQFFREIVVLLDIECYHNLFLLTKFC